MQTFSFALQGAQNGFSECSKGGDLLCGKKPGSLNSDYALKKEGKDFPSLLAGMADDHASREKGELTPLSLTNTETADKGFEFISLEPFSEDLMPIIFEDGHLPTDFFGSYLESTVDISDKKVAQDVIMKLWPGLENLDGKNSMTGTGEPASMKADVPSSVINATGLNSQNMNGNSQPVDQLNGPLALNLKEALTGKNLLGAEVSSHKSEGNGGLQGEIVGARGNSSEELQGKIVGTRGNSSEELQGKIVGTRGNSSEELQGKTVGARGNSSEELQGKTVGTRGNNSEELQGKTAGAIKNGSDESHEKAGLTIENCSKEQIKGKESEERQVRFSGKDSLSSPGPASRLAKGGGDSGKDAMNHNRFRFVQDKMPSNLGDGGTRPEDPAVQEESKKKNDSVNKVTVVKLDAGADNFKAATTKIPGLEGEQLNPKSVAIEPGNGGTVISSSNSLSHDSLSETGSTSRGSETFQKQFETGVLAQIADKAAINLKGRQSAIKISLKPETLGHLRMQITTENNQVMLKILAEAPLAKEIIENNISQLKASLQNHGLEIDKLDVFVADDSKQHDEGRKSHAFMKMQGEYEEENEDDILMAEETEETAGQSDDTTGMNLVNFFA